MPTRLGVPVIVLAGGRGRRLGGAPEGTDKAALTWHGRPLLEHVLAAAAPLAAETAPVVVVGETRPLASTPTPVTWAREEPAGGGPAAGLMAGLDAVARSPAGERWARVVVVAVDMPRLTTATLTTLLAAAEGRDGSALVRDGRRQLALALDVARLRATAPGPPYDRMPMHRLLAGVDLVEVAPAPGEVVDVDTRADLARLDGVRVEVVTEAAWERWARMRLAALADAPDAFGSTLAEWADADADRWRDRLRAPGRCFLASTHGPTSAADTAVDVGMAAVTPVADGRCELISMWVAPPGRGRGVSDLLVGGVADHAATLGADHLDLAVREHNRPARSAYRRLGFAETGDVVDPGAPSARRELVMRLRVGGGVRS